MRCGKSSTDRARRLLHATVVIVIALAAAIWQTVIRGQDFNWDRQNYHVGIPFLLNNRTFWKSIAPAGIQSYFNPYVFELQFFALRHLSAICFAVTLAVVQSFAFLIAGLMSAQIAQYTDAPYPRPTGPSLAGAWQATGLAVLGFLLSLLAPVALSELGTTYIDLITAVPVLAAYALLLTRGRWIGLFASAALAGVLLGTATAFKLTNGVFAFGAVGFAFTGPESWRRRIAWLSLCGGSAAVAFAAIAGPWMVGLGLRFGNPVFPYYNNIFRSPDYPPVGLSDTRFLPHSILAIWHYPLYWLLGGSPTPGLASPSSEVAFRDARWVFAVFGTTLFLLRLLVSPRWARVRLAAPPTGVIFAFAIGYVAWLFEFGVQRYATSLDILCGLVLLALVMTLRSTRWRVGILLGVLLFAWPLMRVPNWGRLPWRPYWQAFDTTPIHFDGASIVFLAVKPSLFIAASLSPDTRYVGINGDFDLRAGNDTTLTRQLKRELSSPHHFQLKEVDAGTLQPVSAAILASYGLVVTDRCQPLHVAGKNFRICEVSR